MYLKSIEIQGFKSFANKLTFEFHNGITGIVGPNGSGKSNVADAVRWVLGEQRIKQLRGASMQDVIFSGTELRKPQGFACVSITLDNSDHQLSIDYDQVTVSRRLYRSVESEYRINGNLCRLKDINELFYDTGIGKEGYSIIGQGQIDRILSGKPEERRELFDEAAGIVKFKRRKAIAQKKLEDEAANLVRVKDILAELEKQVGPLERQSKAAREYLQLKERLKLCDANLFLLETAEIEGQLAELGKKEQILQGDLDETREKSKKAREEYDRLQQKLEEAEQAMAARREALSQKTMGQSSLTGQINVLKEQIHTEEMNQEHLKKRRETIGASLKGHELELSFHQEEAKLLEEQIGREAEKLQEARNRMADQDTQLHSLEEAIEGAKAEIIRVLNERAALTAKIQRYEAMLEQVQLRRSQVSQRLLMYKSDESVQDELLSKEEEALKQLTEKIQDSQLAYGAAEELLSQAQQEEKRLNRRLNDTQQEYHMAYTRLESLKNLAERYDGYGNSIRRVMETRDRIRGIHGVVADLISTEQKYETAIETALGGSIQNIVTDSEATAKQLIAYLKKNKFGRATFLPLTSMNGGQAFSKPEALREPGIIGLASSLVQAAPQYSGLVQNLLGRVVVADTIDNAISLAKKFRYSLRIVTLEGELLSPGGSMTGGAFKNSSNLLGRRREIEELEETCKKALKTVEAIQKELNLKEGLVNEKREELEQLQKQLQKLALEDNTIRIRISQLEEKKTQIRDSSGDLVIEHGQLEEQIREIGENRQLLKNDVEALTNQNDSSSQEIEKKSAVLEEARGLREAMAQAVSEAQLSCAGLEQKRSFLKENLARVQGEVSKLKDELLQLENGQEDSGLAIEERRGRIAQLETQIEAFGQEAKRLSQQITEDETAREGLLKSQKQYFEGQEALSDRISALDKDMFRLQAQEEKLRERLETASGYMWNEYQMSISQAEALRNQEYEDMTRLKRLIEELKGSIRALGNVNVNAIEDYRQVSERYEFMRAQHEDLVMAKEELEHIIEALDEGMRRQFAEKFGEIRREFDKVFKELFGGGRGTLELMTEEDILEAGIQIIAQPPGKKLQNMMQLSGGEKALTAISLLFAIQNLKPSPFCLLDEIEAALDDSNVDRFAGYLHKLTKNTQFIVITHRRGTMVSADRLYGITMQEKGVSTLVSVNLIEDSLS